MYVIEKKSCSGRLQPYVNVCDLRLIILTSAFIVSIKLMLWDISPVALVNTMHTLIGVVRYAFTTCTLHAACSC